VLYKISEAVEVLSDKNKRAVFDQFGEEGLKAGPGGGGGARPPGGFSSGFPGGFPGGGPGGFPGSVPGGTTFTFTSSGPGGFGSGFAPTDPNRIFE
jgi:DnaJ family protein B protein 4